jgi:hypothetical protein
MQSDATALSCSFLFRHSTFVLRHSRHCPNGVVTSVPGGGIVQATADFNDDELTVFWPPRASLRGCSFLSHIASMAPEIDCKMQSNPR